MELTMKLISNLINNINMKFAVTKLVYTTPRDLSTNTLKQRSNVNLNRPANTTNSRSRNIRNLATTLRKYRRH